MTSDVTESAPTGLRERKKLRTRRAILETAQAMFVERGYDNVTVTEIAYAVGLSAKTVFSYFPSKEDLVFDRDLEMRALLRDRIRDRAPGRTPLDALVGLLRELIAEAEQGASDPEIDTERGLSEREIDTERGLSEREIDTERGLSERESDTGSRATEELGRLHRMVGDSATLQSRLRLMWEQFEQEVAEVLADEAGEPRHAPRPRVVAAQLLLIFRLMSSDHLLGYLQAHSRPFQRAALETWLQISVELIGGGIADHARRPG
ncbi:MAG: TetR/AcrR family transcriptional regulator [Pseudonocardia sp.]|jgi:AcrR family transcriptional regulator